MKRFAAPGLAAALALACPAAAQQQPPPDGAADYAYLGRVLAFDKTCNILQPMHRPALEATRAEALLNIPPDKLAAAQTRDRQQPAALASDCAAAQAAPFITRAKQAADGQLTKWVMRADAIVQAEAKTPWAAGMTSISALGPVLHTASEGLARSLAEQAGARAQADGFAQAVLRAACPRRATVRSARPRACPEAAPANAEMADNLIKLTETFTVNFAKAAAPN